MARSKLPRSRRRVHEEEEQQKGRGEGLAGVPGGGVAGGGRGVVIHGRGGVSPNPSGPHNSNSHPHQHPNEDHHGSPTFTSNVGATSSMLSEPHPIRGHHGVTVGMDGSSSLGTETTDLDGTWKGASRQSSAYDSRRGSTSTTDSVDMAVIRVADQGSYNVYHKDNSSDFHKENGWIPDDQDDIADRGEVRFDINNANYNSQHAHRMRNKKQLLKLPSKEGHKATSRKKMDFTILDILLNLVSIGSYIADVGSDLFVAYMYYSNKRWWWFGLTIGFVFLPSVIMTMFSLSWYIADHRTKKFKISKIRWASRITFLVLQMAPLLRYIDTTIYGIKSRKMAEEKKHWYDQMLFEDTDSAMLRLFECFMEAAPQLCLQLYIMCLMGAGGAQGSNINPSMYHLLVVGQVLSSLTSMISIAWAMCAYHRSLRLSLDTKMNMTYPGVILQFFWHFFTISSRVIAISLFASYFNRWIFVLAGAHWCAMLVWILIQNTTFCKKKWEEFFFDVVAACVYIFCYFNLTEGHTRLRYLFYYTVVYSENAAMILAWYLFTQTHEIWYHSYGLAAVLLGFPVGVAFQIGYYLKLHPNNRSDDVKKRIPLWRPLHELVGDSGGNSSMEMSVIGGSPSGHGHSSHLTVNNRYHPGEDSDSTDCGRPLMGDIC